MRIIIDIKQGFYHKPNCIYANPVTFLNQSEHDFRLVDAESEKELKNKGWLKCQYFCEVGANGKA